MSESNQGIQPNTISYWEERTINIGDYESRKFGLSITKKATFINKVDKKVLIEARESLAYYPNQSEEEIVENIMAKVKKTLDDQEFFIRSSVNDYVETPNLHKVKDLLGVVMEDTDEELTTTDDKKVVKEKKSKASDFDDVEFDIEGDIEPETEHEKRIRELKAKKLKESMKK